MTTANLTALTDLSKAVEGALGDFYDLGNIAVLLRFQQLRNNVLHPHDSCSWDADGPDGNMRRLCQVLAQQGRLESVENSARRLFAQVYLANTTMREIKDAESDWGGAIATLEDYSDREANQ